MTSHRWRVEVTREDGHWLADVRGLEGAHTYAPNLTALDKYVREVIILAADLPDDAASELEIDYRYDVDDDAVLEALALQAKRRELEVATAELQRSTREVAKELAAHGFSVRDAGPLLGVSPGRISQVREEVDA
jgi:DNA-directed RNA polymerase specialized sigma24 family protein